MQTVVLPKPRYDSALLGPLRPCWPRGSGSC